MKNIIKRILSEEVDKKTQTLLNYIENNGLIKGSKLVGGYKNLRQILKGTDYLTRDVMLKAIFDVCKEKGGFSMEELGLEEITLDEGETLIRKLSFIDKNVIEVVTYEIGDDGYFDEEPVDYLTFNYNSKFRNGNYVLDTIHLYEILDGVMEKYEKDNSDKWH